MPADLADVEAIYRKLGPPIYRRCLKILRRPEEAADAAQEVFVRILRNRDKLPPENERLRWAYAVATRICLTRLRDGAWEKPETVSGLDRPDGNDFLGASPGGEWAADRQLAVRVLEPHDETTKAIAWMVLVDEMTQDEVGNVLDLSRKTIGKKLRAFLEKARSILATEAP